MGSQTKLVLQKLVREVKSRTKGNFDKIDLREEVLKESRGVIALIRGQQRRLDDSFGVDSVGQEALIAVEIEAVDFDRHDFGVSDYGLRMTLAVGLIESLGLLPGDKVELREGEYEARTITIESVDSVLDELRFEDDVDKLAETGIVATVRISSAT